jgi:hypothetical protein
MHPRLDEIRKRLLTPAVPPGPARYRAPARPVVAVSTVRDGVEGSSSTDSGASAKTEVNSSQTGVPVEPAATIELMAEEVEKRAVGEVLQSPNGLALAVAELFEPARQCQERLLEITQVSEAISHLTRLALELREPLKSFHDHIRKLSSSFESMRTFRDELGVLAESFAPVRALHQQVIQMAQTVRMHLAEVADGLEPAKALKVEIADLGAAIDAVSELQTRFYELSEAFGDSAELTGPSEAAAAPEQASLAEVE